MIIKIPKEQMYVSHQGWLQSQFHFSFAQYRDFNNLNFGVLRVLNDDIVQPNSGFEMHPHSDMEIISYVVDGEITHEDSLGNRETLKRGEVQYMSAGTGVMHSEHNHSKKALRLLQIWIVPPKKGVEPLYGSYRFSQENRQNKLLHMVSSTQGSAKIKIYQDVNIFVSELNEQHRLDFTLQNQRQIYFVQIEGSSDVNKIEVMSGDALKISNEKLLEIKALTKSHFLLIEMGVTQEQ